MNDDFENALSWFTSAPAGWIESGKRNLASAAEWTWQVLQGDFYEGASAAQVATGTVISMIPFVDQLCDVRDVVANCKKINDEPESKWNWISLVLTLIGLFPTLGSLAKGCLKVAFAGVKKAGAASGVTPRLSLFTDVAVFQLQSFLSRPDVAKTMKTLRWDNPSRVLAREIRKVAQKLNIGSLRAALNDVSTAAESLLQLVGKWGGSELAKRSLELFQEIDKVRRLSDKKLALVVKDVQLFIECLARRLEIDADMKHRAYLNSVNPHAFVKLSEPEEIAALTRAKPGWVDNTGTLVHQPLRTPPIRPPGWPATACHDTFHKMNAMTIPPGTKLYRIVDPASRDNSICWMTEAEFKKLKSKDQWRRRFAVWANWNSNGEFITYTVPPGPGLNVWEGITASQQLKNTNFVLEGGAHQIVVDPAHLDKLHISPRKRTGWGYDDLGTANNLVGVPVQNNHWG